jgi:hypothetical protein
MALIGYMPNLDVYLSHRGREFKIIPSDFENEKIQKFELGYGLKSFLSPRAKNILVIGGNQTSAENIELSTMIKKNIGQLYTNERPIDQSVCQSKSSISGRLVLVTCRQMAELFWMNELAKEKPATWKFQVLIDKPKK